MVTTLEGERGSKSFGALGYVRVERAGAP